jgi:hypothetical protein
MSVRLAGGGLLLLLVVALWLGLTPLPHPSATTTWPAWIGPVQVVDVVTGTVIRAQALHIEDGRITAMVPADALDPAQRAAMLDMDGAYVVPGLWDMHALLIRYAPALDHPLHLAHGVTRIRNILNCAVDGTLDLYPCQGEKRAWKAAVADGELHGPIIMESGSFPINGPEWRVQGQPEVFDAATPERARAMVRLVAADPNRPDHLKTYDLIPRDSYFALVAEGLAHGIRTNGHVPAGVRVAEAVAAGHQAIAHARVLPIGCSSAEDRIMEMRAARSPRHEWMALALDTFDPERCATLWAQMRDAGTFISPTLVTRWNETAEGIASLLADPEVLRLTPWILRLIQSEDIAPVQARAPEVEAVYREYYEASAARTAEAGRAGVRLLAGTDSHEPGVVPGLGLHHEIALWRKAGIPDADILRALTVNAAAYFGRADDMGQVAPRFVADLVFVAGDPLADAGVLRHPLAVMQAGRLYDRMALDGLLEHAAGVSSGWRFTVHMLRDMARHPAGFMR